MTTVAKKFNHITEQELTLLKKWQGQGKTVCEMVKSDDSLTVKLRAGFAIDDSITFEPS